MPIYATRQDCINYIEGLVIDDNDAFDRLISRAERDIDQSIFARYAILANGRKFDPTVMDANDAAGLRDATCAQVQYRMLMGESFFAQAQYDSVSGPEFNTKGKMPRLGPLTCSELRNQGMMPTGATTRT